MEIKGKHKCPVCGSVTTFTITDMDYMFCDECKEAVSIGQPVKDLRKKLLKEQEVMGLIEGGMNAFDEKGVLHSNSDNDFEQLFIVSTQLLIMLKETINILSDNRLMVGENKQETQDYIKYAEETLHAIQTKYKKK